VNVIDLAQARAERTPHRSGEARCISCRHEWIAVVPTGIEWFECPSCGLAKGRYRFHCAPVDRAVWTCNCGNDVFFVTDKQEIVCPNCGVCKPCP
jgi:hypothetical protein